jgi:hypothetical protein
MGLSYIYKKFSAQDFATVPFNAHKQYNFTSASAASNKVIHYNTSYTSESISQYSSASSAYGGDSKNVTKYNQLDHLFYRDHIQKFGSKKDKIDYLDNRRDLYEIANILSIPSGLYGFKIKKSSFYLSSSIYEITDDSKGNLIISGTNVSNYPNDVQENVFRLDPIKGFKKYDLSTHEEDYVEVTGGDYINGFRIINKNYYRRGLKKATVPSNYSSIETFPKEYYKKDLDDSYFLNEIKYENITFVKTNDFPSLNFNSIESASIRIPHNNRLNFSTNQDFSISFYTTPAATGSDGDMSTTEKRYIISKNGTEVFINSGSEQQDVATISPQFPYEIYMQSQSLFFARSDGEITHTINGEITASGGTAQNLSHILCQVSSSVMQLWFNGNKIAETTSILKKPTRNKSDIFIGSKGILTTSDTGSVEGNKYFNGKLSNINIWTRPWNTTQISNISESINASPFIGNVFYESGLVAITHPKYQTILSGSTKPGTIDTLQFQGSHLIYEHEYQCTVQEHEFNTTLNSTALNQTDSNPYKIASFTTSSHFQPHVTTIGLYNENNELLVVGKLGQPVRKSDKTDMTFIVRWDT